MSNLKVLYAYSSPLISILEVKRLDLPEGSSPAQTYKWLLVQNDELQFLTFKSMGKKENDEFRAFNEAEFQFNNLAGVLSYKGHSFNLSPFTPSEELLRKISSQVLKM